jgi:succinate dehydrogenase / fumarate reductase, membrane anchor subunit
MAHTYGSKRIVVGAHYGMRDWLAQRITAVVMGVFTIVLLVQYLLPAYVRDASGERVKGVSDKFIQLSGYDKWAGIFAPQWMKLLTFVVIVSLAWHAWVGMRDVWMDYVKPFGVRLTLQMLTIVWLVACLGWAIQVLWRI